MSEWLAQYLPQALIVLGLVALIVEVAMLGFATFILFFAGISLMVTGFLMQMGVLPADTTTALWSNTLLTGLLSVVLWKPLRRMQDRTDDKRVTHDFAEQSFVLEQDVDLRGEAVHRYSGIEWRLKSQQPVAAGTAVKVVRTEVGVLWVEAIDS
ncbi:activity regulator of membrane protease YbbK [Bacterioplanes sanyensis]|uniref:Activity regulator of membrane protease YbbK n=1 Tax=Bacterioplanes sanyensis TaxID=1249553 RepID=A0A222FHN2_9GAMM|nr:NfeD family protein [Bacterioplanes sanyensis]ASP38498.1 activity regulator of membrane protease YbbK [Bacterioplanes sanyensis]